MIWAIVSSRSCFCWLYRASPSLAAKNIINLLSVLTFCWCPCVESSLVLLEEGVCYDQCVLLAKLYYLCPASFCTPRPNLPITPGVSWFPTLLYLSLNLAIMSSWSEPQSAPGLIFVDCRASKNVINLILVLTIWWCPCVESSLVLLEEGVCYDQCILLAKLY